MRLENVTLDDISEVVSCDPTRSLTLRVHVSRFRVVVELVVVPVEGASTCEVRFRERPAGLSRHAMPVLRPLIYSRNKEDPNKGHDHTFFVQLSRDVFAD